MIISLVVAAASNNGIGKNGNLPWQLPNDMKHFKNVTWGMPIIMGRKTFDSLGKPLAGRKNIVVSRQAKLKIDGAVLVENIDDALFVAKQTDAKEVMVIGGGEIYKLLFEKATRIYLTRVGASPEADTFFPSINNKDWRMLSQQQHLADDKHAFSYAFELWERI